MMKQQQIQTIVKFNWLNKVEKIQRCISFIFIVKMDINDVCQVCKQTNDDMLMLSCIHNPCINCAASAYAQIVHIKNGNPNVYVCQICGQQTVLDSSTVSQLSSLSRSYVKVPSPAKGNQNKAAGRSGSFDKTAQPKSPKLAQKKTNYFCKVHSEEDLTYYCFSCHQNICPECAIHGAHKDHQVKLIKKAVNQIKSEFLDIISKIGVGQNNMNKFRDGFQRSIKQSNERNAREKALVSQQFELLKNVLTNKEREITKQLDNIHKENITLLQNFVGEIQRLYDQIQKTKKQIEGILKKEDVLVFEEYKNLPKLQEKSQQLKKKSQQISGQNLFLNTEFLQQQLKQIQQIVKKFKYETKKQSVASLSIPKVQKKPGGGE